MTRQTLRGDGDPILAGLLTGPVDDMTEVTMAQALADDDGLITDEQARAAPQNGNARHPQKRRLVMCCDGTWNNPDEMSKGVPAPTNVAKVATGLALGDDTDIPQLLYYQSGVGTRRRQHVRGGVFGYGLSRNVRDCYRFIVETYEPGDELYFFGFSRGAYTARSTIGLIHNCGILRREHQNRLGEAYDLYKSRRPDTLTQGGIAEKLFRRSYSHDDIKIRFVGVWDTVGAIGIPIDGIPIPKRIKRRWGFHDTALSDRVCNAYQALAIDERRRPFKPALWNRKGAAPGQVLEQAWFAGCHRDVGGGNADSSLSDIPLLWMVNRAHRCGLTFKADHFVDRQYVNHSTPELQRARAEGEWVDRDPIGNINESLKGLYRLLVPKRRTIGENRRPKAVADGQCVASSALRRVEKKRRYRPRNLRNWKVRTAGEIDVMDDPQPTGARMQPTSASE